MKKSVLLTATLALVITGAFAQEPVITTTGTSRALEVINGQERVSTQAVEAVQAAEQRKTQGIEKGTHNREQARQNKAKGEERRTAAQVKNQSQRRIQARVASTNATQRETARMQRAGNQPTAPNQPGKSRR